MEYLGFLTLSLHPFSVSMYLYVSRCKHVACCAVKSASDSRTEELSHSVFHLHCRLLFAQTGGARYSRRRRRGHSSRRARRPSASSCDACQSPQRDGLSCPGQGRRTRSGPTPVGNASHPSTSDRHSHTWASRVVTVAGGCASHQNNFE